MARKVTPLHAETLTLLKVWALDETPASKSKFISSRSPAYKTALKQLVEIGALTEAAKNKRTNVYDITEEGKTKLSEGLSDSGFAFHSVAGPKTTNALLKWFRHGGVATNGAGEESEQRQNGSHIPAAIGAYDEFEQIVLDTYDRLNRDYNLGDLVPIYRLRREVGDRISRQKFNEWLLEIQVNDLVQLMGGDLPNATSDQLEDSVSIPGGGTRFYLKRL